MTNAIAIGLGLVILAVFLVDALFLHMNMPLFLAKQFAVLVEYVSFWR